MGVSLNAPIGSPIPPTCFPQSYPQIPWKTLNDLLMSCFYGAVNLSAANDRIEP
jgi:hypothetical protein